MIGNAERVLEMAARLVEQMEEEGIIGPSEGVRGRTVLGTRAKSPADPYGDTPPWDETE